MNTLEDKILGSLYGFVIGDAMGATTEFMSKKQIKDIFGEVNEILGGGWLNLEKGEVTDDSQMTFCVMDALMNCADDKDRFRRMCKNNFIVWYYSNPKDIGGQCAKAIKHLIDGHDYAEVDLEALGNGSLMRAMPCAILKNHEMNLIQGRLTHHSYICDEFIFEYSLLLESLIYDIHVDVSNLAQIKKEPTGYIVNTLNNAKFILGHSRSFEDGMIEAVNDGGDADTIAAITGSLLGAKYGYSKIPKRWLEDIGNDTKKMLKKFYFFTKTCLQNKGYMI